jgi:uncharacterized membrane protein/mono/diheme cytochrome c family protein
MIMLTIQEFIGRFHPVLVHLPIGILFFAFLLQIISRLNKAANFQHAIEISLLAGMLSAILSCITGYLLSQSGDYNEDAVFWHQWMGISTALVSVVLYYLYKKKQTPKWQWPGMIILFLLIIVTGHLGGTLTHGSGYLTQALSSTSEKAITRKPIENVQEALVYKDVIQPLLQTKCYTCHNANKKKGGLRMDDSATFMAGGKDGVVLIAGNAEESKMIKRILLAPEEEKHMPPKEKPQLTEHEIALLHWWIASGASFHNKVKDLAQTDKVKPALLALQSAPEVKAAADVPETPASKADAAAIKKLQDLGVVVLPVAQNSNYLLVNFVIADSISHNDIRLLLPLKEQLTWLKLSSSTADDSALAVINQCKNITRLNLDHTRITDEGLSQLKDLQELRYLNLVGTKVTLKGIQQLKGLKKLHSLYLYQTNISKADWTTLQQQLPNVHLDSGGYVVPLLETDTTVMKYVPPKQ